MSAPRAHRPVFLNLARIRFPVGAWASIGHRISGVVLVLLLPLAVLALERSLAGEAAFAALFDYVHSPVGRVALLVVAWASAHHLFAGIRHLLMDVGIGASLSAARASAYAALGAGAAVAAAAAVLA
jgi:succinate dehydrogenase / fumarate reductase, cytochrome b subunit